MEYMGSFFALLDIQHALYVEVMCVISVVEYARLKDFKKLWLECDSFLLYQAFGSAYMIP